MPRGGKRENSGRKFTWEYGKTKAIRVPEAIVDEVLAYARKLDNDYQSKKFTDSVTESDEF